MACVNRFSIYDFALHRNASLPRLSTDEKPFLGWQHTGDIDVCVSAIMTVLLFECRWQTHQLHEFFQVLVVVTPGGVDDSVYVRDTFCGLKTTTDEIMPVSAVVISRQQLSMATVGEEGE